MCTHTRTYTKATQDPYWFGSIMKCGCSFNEPEGPESLSDRWKITISTQCVRRRQRRWLRRRRLEMSTKYKRSAASRLFRMISLAKRKLWQLHAIRQSLSLSVAQISPTEIHYHRSEHWLCVANLIKSDNILSRSVYGFYHNAEMRTVVRNLLLLLLRRCSLSTASDVILEMSK